MNCPEACFRSNHPLGGRKQFRAFILLLRYSGLRIGDAVSIERDRLAGGSVFLFTAKTGTPVRCLLPQVAQDAIDDLSEIDGDARLPFFSGNGQLKTAVPNWQRTIEKLAKIAGVANFHAHRFRDTAAVSWLQHGDFNGGCLNPPRAFGYQGDSTAL
jgi:integrase/recombinase XerD